MQVEQVEKRGERRERGKLAGWLVGRAARMSRKRVSVWLADQEARQGRPGCATQ